MNVCPSCKTKIYNPSASFCYKCGHRINENTKKVENKISLGHSNNKIDGAEKTDINSNVSNFPKTANEIGNKTVSVEPPQPVQEKPVYKPSVSTLSEDKLTKRWNYFVLGLNALSIMFLVVSLGLFFRANKDYVSSNFNPTVEVSLVEIEDVNPALLDYEILNSDFYSIVPKGAVLYVEASNLSDFITTFLSSEQITYLENTYELSIEDFLVFLKPTYAYVKTEGGFSALIVETAGFDFFERTYSKYQENKVQSAVVTTTRVGEFLVISSDEDYINLIADVEIGTSPSIDSDPSFNRSISLVSSNPYLFIFTESFDYVLDNLSGELENLGFDFLYDEVEKAGTRSFYVTKEGSKYYVRPLELD